MTRSEQLHATAGYIHSIESFGTVDGPGVRFVVFFQGCPLRCVYCHNPDTWEPGTGRRVSVSELMDQFRRNRAFYAGGGVTATGGEPMLQMDFLIEFFRCAKAEGVHTCLDTSGAVFSPGLKKKIDELMRLTDLVLLDIKRIDEKGHRELTGQGNAGILAFARYLSDIGKDVWIRHVVIPGLTDDEQSLAQLGRFIASLSNVKALDVLAYHTMGKGKYKEMGMDYPLGDTPPLSRDALLAAKRTILRACRREKTAADQR